MKLNFPIWNLILWSNCTTCRIISTLFYVIICRFHCIRSFLHYASLQEKINIMHIYGLYIISLAILNTFLILANQSTAMKQEHAEELVCTTNVCYGEVTSGRMQPEKNANIPHDDDDEYIWVESIINRHRSNCWCMHDKEQTSLR